MALRLIYLMFSKLLDWMVCTRSDSTKEIEILVLRCATNWPCSNEARHARG